MSPPLITLGDWTTLAPSLQSIRRTVFIVEQGVPEALEWDEYDAVSLHALARVDDRIAGCARLLPDGHIGRMAVLADLRRSGVGSALLGALIGQARHRGIRRLQLHAQVHALPFYARAGFVAEGPVFDEAGIAHRLMCRPCAS